MKHKVCSERGAKRMRAQLGMKRVLQKVVCLLLSAVMLAGGVSFASADVLTGGVSSVSADVQMQEQGSGGAARKRTEVTYTEGMTVSDADTLYSLYMQAQADLLPRLKLRTTERLYRVFDAESAVWSPSVSTYTYATISGSAATIDVQFNYTVEYEVECLLRNAQAEAAASDAAIRYAQKLRRITKAAIKACRTQKQKVKAINAYMVKHYTYDDRYADASYSFTGLLDHKKGVCKGYAELFRLMCLQAGIRTESVTGLATSGPGQKDYELHMWSRSKINGKWYYTDVTFNDGAGSNQFLLLPAKRFYGKGYHYLQQ